MFLGGLPAGSRELRAGGEWWFGRNDLAGSYAREDGPGATMKPIADMQDLPTITRKPALIAMTCHDYKSAVQHPAGRPGGRPLRAAPRPQAGISVSASLAQYDAP